jgi:hypothetical protein
LDSNLGRTDSGVIGWRVGLVDENRRVIKRGKGREEGVLRMAARRATASGGGTKPGAEPEKTSRLVSKSRCIGFGEGGEVGEAAADFLLRRRVFLDEARPSARSAATLPLVSPPSCATGIVIAGRR